MGEGPASLPGPRYVPLWCKSHYSFLEGASSPEDLVETAQALGLPALALTDRHGVYGAVRGFDRARALGFPLLYGAQVTLAPLQPGQGVSTVVLLAENREGWASLCTLLSAGHRGPGPEKQLKGQFTLSARQLAEAATGQGHAGLSALWTPEATPRATRRPGPELSFDADLRLLKEAFGGRLSALVARHRWTTDRPRELTTLAWARRFDVAPVAAPEVLYHAPERQELQDALTCIRLGLKLSSAGTALKPNAEFALKSAADVAALYADHPEWVERSGEIAAGCHFSLGELQYLYPEEGVPQGYTTAGWLSKLTDDGAHLRYGSVIPAAVQAQVSKELELIAELGYAGYFLTMWELVQFCRKNNILCQGRGSAANSAVCFCLGITAIDPVRMDLLFERFLSRERAEPPDIDLDIEHHRREEVIQHMYRRYGRHRAAMVANVVRYRGRSALREVGKVLELPEVALDRSSKLLSHHEEGLAGAFRDGGLGETAPEVLARLVRLAGQIRGFPRHLSIHPGGFLIGSEALDRLVPQENATMEDRTIIQWDKTDVETMNLFKVDLLGLGALTHLDYAFRLLKVHQNTDLSMATIPAGDRATFDMICRADTVGVFQIESRAQMSMLPRLKPRTYYDIVIQVSLIRPGPITGGMVHPYLRRRAGEEAVDYPHPSLEPVLKKTLGIPLFQEQVMKLAIVAADYSPGEADQLRRDMAAWKQLGRIEGHHDKLVARMTAKGIDPEFAERVFGQIRGFGEYGFPESHAASFSLIAYATAYLKCHYPEVFACALLNAWPMGFYSPATIIGDAQRHLVTVLPIDLLHSDWDCTLEKVPSRRPEGEPSLAIRLGLRYVRGLAKVEAERVLSVRPKAESPPLAASMLPGSTLPLATWKARARARTDTWEKLAVAGALEGYGLPRRQSLWQVLDLATPAAMNLEDASTQTFSELSEPDLVVWDYAATGSSARAHPLRAHRLDLQKQRFQPAAVVNLLEGAHRVRSVGLIICRQMPENAKGVLFLTLEDETGLMNVVVWKKVWDRYRKIILTSPLIAVEGKVQSQDGVVHLIADVFWTPEGLFRPGEIAGQSHDFR
ncbi:MAG: error-prone DNA polymerase [Spirochaetales bacterium]